VLFAAVFGGLIVRQFVGRGPSVWLILLVGALLTLATGVLPLGQVGPVFTTTGPVLLFLLAMFLFAGALEEAGALDHLARWIVGRAHRSGDLPAALFLGFGLISAFVVNDALVLVGVPVLISVARRLRTEALPLLLVLAFSVTVGSTLLPFANPQNLLISVESGVNAPVEVFLRYLLLPTAINLALGAWFLRRVLGAKMRPGPSPASVVPEDAPDLFPRGNWGRRLARAPVLAIFPVTLGLITVLGIAVAFVPAAAIPIWEPAMAGAILMLLLGPGRIAMLKRVNWTLLVLFAALFLVVAGAVYGGVVAALETALPLPGPSNPTAALVAIFGTSTVGPQFVSNVPWVAIQIPVFQSAGYGAGTPVPWMALAAASTLAGNVTLLGAPSNLIIADLAEKGGVPIRLGTFARYGLPLAALTLAVTFGCLYFGL